MEIIEPAFDQGDPLGAAPALDLLLERIRILDARELSRPRQPHRAPASEPGVRGPEPEVVLADASVEVRRTADVEGSVRALEDVGPRHVSEPSRSRVSGNAGGTGCGEVRGVSTRSAVDGLAARPAVRLWTASRLDQRWGWGRPRGSTSGEAGDGLAARPARLDRRCGRVDVRRYPCPHVRPRRRDRPF